MKVKEAIQAADALRPNMIDAETKAAWLFELEGEIAETMGETPPVNDWPAGDSDMLMPYPHDGIYQLYLCAMIDNANQETALYANDMAVANRAIQEAKAWWRRSHTPPAGYVRCMQ